MKKYYFYSINESFYDLFAGDNKKAFLELFYRKNDSVYYEKQFSLFLNDININQIIDVIDEKYSSRKDYRKENNKIILRNFITSNHEILTYDKENICIETDYECSPFIKTLADYFPDLVCIDTNKCKIDSIGLVSSINIR